LDHRGGSSARQFKKTAAPGFEKRSAMAKPALLAPPVTRIDLTTSLIVARRAGQTPLAHRAPA
jgi:hypothetical protein